MSQLTQIYKTSPASINTPNPGTLTLYQSSVDDIFYAMDENRVSYPIGSTGVSGYLLGNIVVADGTSSTINVTEVTIEALQLSEDFAIDTINLPNTTTINRGIVLIGTVVSTLSCPLLSTLGGTLGGIFISECPLFTSLNFPSIASIDYFLVKDCRLVTSVSLPSLSSVNEKVTISSNETLSTISFTSFGNCLELNFSFNELDTATVDAILADLAATGQIGGELDLSGGTNSTPTGGAANLDYLTLLGNGWTVTINP
jgi:hypothetical protein